MSLPKLLTLIDDVKEKITDGEYLEIMNILGDLYKEIKAQNYDSYDDEFEIILTQNDIIVINEIRYYMKRIDNKDVVFDPSGNVIGIWEGGGYYSRRVRRLVYNKHKMLN